MELYHEALFGPNQSRVKPLVVHKPEDSEQLAAVIQHLTAAHCKDHDLEQPLEAEDIPRLFSELLCVPRDSFDADMDNRELLALAGLSLREAPTRT